MHDNEYYKNIGFWLTVRKRTILNESSHSL